MALTSTERSRRWRARMRGSAPDEPIAIAIRRGHRNRAATEKTIAALRRAGRLDDDADAALVAVARATADGVDEASTAYMVSIIARVHLVALRALMAGPEPADDELDQFIRSLREVT